MAQDAEKTAVGKTFVMDTPDGKMLDMKGGFGALLASVAHLNEKIEKLQSKKGKK